MKQISEPEMMHRMAAWCSSAERCEQDVRTKITTAGLPAEAADRIITRLTQEKFLNEQRFARSFVNDKLRFNKWGRVKIAYELARKGISPFVRQEALEGIDEQEYTEILYSLLKSKKKTAGGKDERDTWYKLLRFASGRGFESREATLCLRRLFKGNDYEEDMG
ncbi:regulatory protein [Parabacteroides sp. PF5-5]|uniref:regulatory protein RecX n=1 Tax=unclassified Parabacteroides TaxID=2649774 RepID=UPI002472FEB1|nr:MULTISPECIES: regulatory protein RecX [unclassified Parabacteroides]MDH6306083.1 regulatory protein [Parabacteroides sp. PH5-39]MDH6317019.1 regulatory protein [Parabacteroides sp. PF5-13]MDH6320772.1 regulatory protein [Parabacteroides sp. PH5-13]MDH6324526.1 regulatory protein [Parabacteroides sp. PH5-8]MDH6328204.1 regulatory protein [Parabacteroides sp. PH5-41]